MFANLASSKSHDRQLRSLLPPLLEIRIWFIWKHHSLIKNVGIQGCVQGCYRAIPRPVRITQGQLLCTETMGISELYRVALPITGTETFVTWRPQGAPHGLAAQSHSQESAGKTDLSVDCSWDSSWPRHSSCSRLGAVCGMLMLQVCRSQELGGCGSHQQGNIP